MMSKYEARQCKEPPDEKWCVFFGGTLIRECDDKSQAFAEAERLQRSWEDMVEHAQKQQAKAVGAADDKGLHIGSVHRADEYHLLQSVGQSRFVIHRRAALTAPLLIEIQYRDGRGSVVFRTGKELER
jgi:hypothetical protein